MAHLRLKGIVITGVFGDVCSGTNAVDRASVLGRKPADLDHQSGLHSDQKTDVNLTLKLPEAVNIFI
jgi:hypothetical protein